jgi:hypothetical protein
MRFQVPQNVDIEDKIVGPLTGKQFGWIIAACIILFVSFKIFDTATFVAIAVVVVGLAVTFAFVRPYGQPMVVFVSNVFLYLFKSREYVWRRKGPQFKQDDVSKRKGEELTIIRKGLPDQKVEDLARVLDSDGERLPEDKSFLNQ